MLCDRIQYTWILACECVVHTTEGVGYCGLGQLEQTSAPDTRNEPRGSSIGIVGCHSCGVGLQVKFWPFYKSNHHILCNKIQYTWILAWEHVVCITEGHRDSLNGRLHQIPKGHCTKSISTWSSSASGLSKNHGNKTLDCKVHQQIKTVQKIQLFIQDPSILLDQFLPLKEVFPYVPHKLISAISIRKTRYNHSPSLYFCIWSAALW